MIVQISIQDIRCITKFQLHNITWWRHQMETFSALLAICAGNSPVPGEFPAQRPVTRSFDVFFDLVLNKRLCKWSWGWWFEVQLRPLWLHCNDFTLLVLKLHHTKITRSIPWLLMGWLLDSPGWISANVVLTVSDKQLPVPYQCWEMRENTNWWLSARLQ